MCLITNIFLKELIFSTFWDSLRHYTMCTEEETALVLTRLNRSIKNFKHLSNHILSLLGSYEWRLRINLDDRRKEKKSSDQSLGIKTFVRVVGCGTPSYNHLKKSSDYLKNMNKRIFLYSGKELFLSSLSFVLLNKECKTIVFSTIVSISHSHTQTIMSSPTSLPISRFTFSPTIKKRIKLSHISMK